MRVYIAGPMTGIPQFNFPAFDAAAEFMRERGFEVVSPAELDDPEDRERALASPDGSPVQYTYGKTHADFLARDLKIIADSIDAVLVLDGWENSTGARIETFIAFAYRKPVVMWSIKDEAIVNVPSIVLARAWLSELFRQVIFSVNAVGVRI